MLKKAGERHIFGNRVVRDQSISPGLAAIARRMTAGVAAPFERRIALRQHVGIVHLIGGFGFLPRQVVKQVGMFVIGDVIEVNEAADDIVFEALSSILPVPTPMRSTCPVLSQDSRLHLRLP